MLFIYSVFVFVCLLLLLLFIFFQGEGEDNASFITPSFFFIYSVSKMIPDDFQKDCWQLVLLLRSEECLANAKGRKGLDRVRAVPMSRHITISLLD